LAHVSQELSSILDVDELLSKVAVTIRALIPFDAFSIFLVDHDRALLRCRFSQRYDERSTIDNIEIGKGVTGAAAQTREVIRVGDVTQDPRYIETHPDIRSEVAVPLVLRDRVIGVFDLESIRLNFFTEDHVRALNLLAPQIATSVENARLYEELAQREQRMDADLQAAYKLQSVLMPRTISEIAGLEVGLDTRPARQISGDVYDFFEHGDEYSLIAFGDVSGKGAAAALYGALISGLLRTIAPRRRSPSELMKALNDALLERKVDSQYATLSLILWSARARNFTIVSAGTLPPLLCRQGTMVELKAEGVPIGLLQDQHYDQLKISADSGNLLVLYSDGVEDQLGDAAGALSETDMIYRDPESYGLARLKKVVRAHCKQAPQKIVQGIFNDIDKFRGATPLTDDQTVRVLRVL
jgi:sigma-B regulation protein RsbU (phosphoserine phosphatase)